MKFAKFALAGAAAAGLVFASLTAVPTFAKEATVMVGGAPMFPSKNIIQNAVNSKDHTTLVAAVKAADLVDTLSGKGPFTVFAPTNDAFAKLPAGTVDTLLKPENKGQLTQVLTYHVVPGRITAKDLMAAVEKGGGKAMYKTVEGEELTVEVKDGADLDLGRQGRRRQDHHQERDAVERRDPRHRHRAAAELVPPLASATAKPAVPKARRASLLRQRR